MHLPAYICRVSFDPKYFIQGNSIESSAELRIRYKLKFTLYTGATPVEVACHMEENESDGKFELKWACIPNPGVHWQSIKTKLDVVRPGRYDCTYAASFLYYYRLSCRNIDMRIVTHLQNPECKRGNPAFDIAEKIAASMTRE